MRCCAVVFLACLGAASTARAWESFEHQEIGQASYQRACDDLTAAVASAGPAPAGVRVRLEIACGQNSRTMAALYGDFTALAGDYFGHPSEFFSRYGAWRFSSRTSYWLLAMENVHHFHPMATQAWTQYHVAALEHALAGSAVEGLASIERFQLTIQESAFADHHLQDSFAAGHMGFNRAASSAAAAKSFHDAWNARGRLVRDRAGDRWTTYGDGRLDSKENQEGRRHVVDVSTSSVRGVLSVYVLGRRSAAGELSTWQALPFEIEAPTLLPDLEEAVVRDRAASRAALVPLLGTIRPARKDTVATATFWSMATFDHPGDALVAGVGGFELAVPYLPAQAYLGAGATLRETEQRHTPLVETGVVFPFALSIAGLLSHQLNVTVTWLLRSAFAAIAHAEYQLSLELAKVIVGAQVGVAEILPQLRTGWYGGVGVGFAFSAAGGGSL